MKLLFSTLIIIVFMACKAPKNTIDTYRVTKIQIEKDGKTLFIKNRKGDIYSTVISLANGNYIDVNMGDVITLEVKEILDMTPPAIISKNIKVVRME